MAASTLSECVAVVFWHGANGSPSPILQVEDPTGLTVGPTVGETVATVVGAVVGVEVGVTPTPTVPPPQDQAIIAAATSIIDFAQTSPKSRSPTTMAHNFILDLPTRADAEMPLHATTVCNVSD
jgi:hypothetical protein